MSNFTDGLRKNIREFPDFPEHLRDLFEADILRACESLEATEAENTQLQAEVGRSREALNWLLEEYHFLSRKMTEINNIVQPLWGELSERRNDYQLVEKFIERIQEEGLEQTLKGE
ncbi:hypothetical protein LCGC14_2020510 [marine sediment metagenome]|uniref:Uncharacterized protein n=1 Tax=marine sediment metagenome TaxID=412755 RepID=A0A0F9FK78_9ZZZZ